MLILLLPDSYISFYTFGRVCFHWHIPTTKWHSSVSLSLSSYALLRHSTTIPWESYSERTSLNLQDAHQDSNVVMVDSRHSCFFLLFQFFQRDDGLQRDAYQIALFLAIAYFVVQFLRTTLWLNISSPFNKCLHVKILYCKHSSVYVLPNMSRNFLFFFF